MFGIRYRKYPFRRKIAWKRLRKFVWTSCLFFCSLFNKIWPTEYLCRAINVRPYETTYHKTTMRKQRNCNARKKVAAYRVHRRNGCFALIFCFTFSVERFFCFYAPYITFLGCLVQILEVVFWKNFTRALRPCNVLFRKICRCFSIFLRTKILLKPNKNPKNCRQLQE